MPILPANWQEEEGKLKAALLLIQGGALPEFIPILADIDHNTTTLGSSDKNTVRLLHRYIDDRQCAIKYEDFKFYISDGKPHNRPSENGTYVNGIRLELDEQQLKSGDVIQFGPIVKYSFRTRGDEGASVIEVDEKSAPTIEAIMNLDLADPVVRSGQHR